MTKIISTAKLAIISPAVLAAITEACRNGDQTPTYADLVRLCAEAGVATYESEIAPVLLYLETIGRMRRIGSRNRMIYSTASGQTVPRESVPHGVRASARGPSLAERAAMWGVPLMLTHQSDRLVISRYPARPIVSAAGRWSSSLADL